jgi:molybdenum cofactor cytidylyltransferase
MKSELVSVVIPAAGNSGRMGFNKALLELPGGINFANHMLNSYRTYGAESIILVINDNLDISKLQAGPWIIVVNKHVDRGRSYSVKLGIDRVPGGQGCFIQNIDNPFADKALLETMHSALRTDGYVVPVYDGKGGHPVLLGSRVVDHIHALNEGVDFRDVLKRFTRIEVPYNGEGILWNINTPGDYDRFMKSY